MQGMRVLPVRARSIAQDTRHHSAQSIQARTARVLTLWVACATTPGGCVSGQGVGTQRTRVQALKDFRDRIAKYEEVYETITDRSLHYIKLIDMWAPVPRCGLPLPGTTSMQPLQGLAHGRLCWAADCCRMRAACTTQM